MDLCDLNCVVLQTNRASCAVYNEIVDLHKEEGIFGAHSDTTIDECDEKSTTSV